MASYGVLLILPEGVFVDLKGKTVAITGAGRGLGRATALSLADKGAQLALLDLDAQLLAETAGACRERGVQVAEYQADISHEETVESTFAAIAEEFGALHGLVNNAGITRDGLLVKARDGKVQKKLSLDHWQAVINVNLTGVFLCAREAAAQMIETGSEGAIVNISSISRHGNVGQSNYTAAKAGVAGMTVTWARELARYGVRVAAIAPGFINTPMVQNMKPEVLEKLVGSIPLRRLGQAEDIAKGVIFIFENDYVSGRVIEIDGGLRL